MVLRLECKGRDLTWNERFSKEDGEKMVTNRWNFRRKLGYLVKGLGISWEIIPKC